MSWAENLATISPGSAFSLISLEWQKNITYNRKAILPGWSNKWINNFYFWTNGEKDVSLCFDRMSWQTHEYFHSLRNSCYTQISNQYHKLQQLCTQNSFKMRSWEGGEDGKRRRKKKAKGKRGHEADGSWRGAGGRRVHGKKRRERNKLKKKKEEERSGRVSNNIYERRESRNFHKISKCWEGFIAQRWGTLKEDTKMSNYGKNSDNSGTFITYLCYILLWLDSLLTWFGARLKILERCH